MSSVGPRVPRSRPTTAKAARGPFALLAHIPVAQDMEPVRFSLFTALFVAVVLGAGLGELALARPAGSAPGPRAPARHLFGGRAAVVAAIGVMTLLPLIPRWPYPAGPAVTPRFFYTPAVERIPPGAVVVTLPYPARGFNAALVWQAETRMRFRLVGGSPFFVPGSNGRSFDSRFLELSPHGIDRVFENALAPPRRGMSRSCRRWYPASATISSAVTSAP